MAVKVRARQTPVDIAVQQQGTAEAVFSVAQANGISITTDLIPGNNVAFGDVQVADVAAYFNKYGPLGTFPASAINITDVVQPGGIGFMGIQIDFKVR